MDESKTSNRGKGRRNATPGAFGSVDRLPSGRYRAMYRFEGRRYSAPTTFTTKADARAYLAVKQSEIIRGAWVPPDVEKPKAVRATFAEYSASWLANRTVKGVPLKDRTRSHYRKLIDAELLPTFGALPLGSITVDDVEQWYVRMGERDAPTLRAHCYSLLKTIMTTATSARGPIAGSLNPCVIAGAGSSRRVHKIEPATLVELATLAEAMPASERAMILLAAWCALRFGELTELRRKDLVLHVADPDEPKAATHGTIKVRRAVVRTDDGFKVTTPKSDAGVRDVAIPPHLVPVVAEHLDRHVGADREALLFPADSGGHLAPATLYRRFYVARDAAGRSDLRFHDLRHSGAVLAAATGASLAELMARLGHSTPAAAMRYQHAAQGRDRKIAALLSKLATSVDDDD